MKPGIVAVFGTALVVGVAVALGGNIVRGEPERETTVQSDKENKDAMLEKATFGAGCFWGVEAAFRQVEGVKETAVGYMGGTLENPSYKEVCTDTTGHAEVVQVTFDPAEVSYGELLKVFWKSHDPTQVNRQGPDVGTQYRTVVFYHTPEQHEAAMKSRDELEKSGKYRRPIATAIEPAAEFWRAEEYHQRYLEKRGLASCHVSLQE